jgi:hypothetical protein
MSEGQKYRKFKGIFEPILAKTPLQAPSWQDFLIVSWASEDVESALVLVNQ